MIPPSVFTQKMQEQWKQFGNIPSPALTQAWKQQCEVFTEAIRLSAQERNTSPFDDIDGADTVWKILQPPTGAGKTLGTIVYATLLGLLPREYHPGVLVVTRLIQDADLIAEQINELSRSYLGEADKVAVSYHSENKKLHKLTDLADYPVLVITHRAYVLALDSLDNNSKIEETWKYFYEFYNGQRGLVVIDEAIDLIENTSLSLDHVRSLLWCIPQEVRVMFPSEIEFLKALEGILERLETDAARERVIATQPLKERHPISSVELSDHENEILASFEGEMPRLNFAALKDRMKGVRFDQQIGKDDAEENVRLAGIYRERLSMVDALYQSWFYFSKDNTKPTFHTARLLVPKQAKGAVILDATAGCNVMYELFDNAQVIEPPQGTRNYRNVTLHVSSGHRTGKNYMREHPKELSEALILKLEEEFRNDDTRRNVLVVTHKKVEPYLIQYQPQFFDLKVAHWGAINGSNEWKDCDTVVIFGLPYRPPTFPASAFMAFRGVQSTEWLNSPEKRGFKGYSDIREAIATGQMVTDMVQAINRVRCRKVTDVRGNCPTTDVYLLLGTKETGEEILQKITKQMPNVHVADWDYTGQKQKKRGAVRKGNYEESLVSYLTNTLTVGSKISKKEVNDVLGIPSRTMQRIVARIQEEGDPLVKTLKDSGVEYRVERKKRTQRGYFYRG